MPIIAEYYISMKDYIESLRTTFIRPLDGDDSLSPDERYKYFVKSFCVFSHAALEDFFETLSLRMAAHSIDKFVFSGGRKIDRCVPALIYFYGDKAPRINEDDEINAELTTFDALRNRLDEVKKTHSILVKDNHGVSKKYLRKLLMPVGIDVPHTVTFHDELLRLARWRGEYAHKQQATKIPSHLEVEKGMKDLCDELSTLVADVEARG